MKSGQQLVPQRVHRLHDAECTGCLANPMHIGTVGTMHMSTQFGSVQTRVQLSEQQWQQWCLARLLADAPNAHILDSVVLTLSLLFPCRPARS
jgi:hypothetical protein